MADGGGCAYIGWRLAAGRRRRRGGKKKELWLWVGGEGSMGFCGLMESKLFAGC